ncbi:unnamed protein product [Musa acuminata subsp. burmannicoides]
MSIALVTNVAVHVAMYAYYLSSSADCCWSLCWKRGITELQIAQFVFSYLRISSPQHSGLLIRHV